MAFQVLTKTGTLKRHFKRLGWLPMLLSSSCAMPTDKDNYASSNFVISESKFHVLTAYASNTVHTEDNKNNQECVILKVSHSIYLWSVCLNVYSPTNLSTYLSICLFIKLHKQTLICLFVYQFPFVGSGSVWPRKSGVGRPTAPKQTRQPNRNWLTLDVLGWTVQILRPSYKPQHNMLIDLSRLYRKKAH